MPDAALKERWSTMSAREKDIAVAKAKGWTQIREHVGWAGPYGIPPGQQVPVGLPHFSSSWAYAGILLEKLAQNCPLMLRRDVEGWSVSIALGQEVRGLQSAPDAIALAYVLAEAPHA